MKPAEDMTQQQRDELNEELRERFKDIQAMLELLKRGAEDKPEKEIDLPEWF